MIITHGGGTLRWRGSQAERAETCSHCIIEMYFLCVHVAGERHETKRNNEHLLGFLYTLKRECVRVGQISVCTTNQLCDLKLHDLLAFQHSNPFIMTWNCSTICLFWILFLNKHEMITILLNGRFAVHHLERCFSSVIQKDLLLLKIVEQTVKMRQNILVLMWNNWKIKLLCKLDW